MLRGAVRAKKPEDGSQKAEKAIGVEQSDRRMQLFCHPVLRYFFARQSLRRAGSSVFSLGKVGEGE